LVLVEGGNKLKGRTLVKLSAGKYCVGFRTIRRDGKSPGEFVITRSTLDKLGCEQDVIANDIHSFAILRRNIAAGTIRIDFTWLHSDGGTRVTGHRETVTIRYDGLMAFVRSNAEEGGPSQWATLSIIEGGQPRLVFHDVEGLRRCLENHKVRRKLLRFLRDNFKYSMADEIDFYHDFEPYSFSFREIYNGNTGIVGGLILHNHDDMERAYYSTHT